MNQTSQAGSVVDAIADVQGSHDGRNIRIDQVGIKSIRHPIKFADQDGIAQTVVAILDMTVGLPHDIKGTHMSRFIEVLGEHEQTLTVESLPKLMDIMLTKLDAREGRIQMSFPYFLSKEAPVSKVTSLLDYDVELTAANTNGHTEIEVKVQVPVTSLCPCSKKISEYGAHNQRSHVTLTLATNRTVWVTEIIKLVENEASCELYGLLKRPDEKYVTEKAYDNPKFVEDMVRDIADKMNRDERVTRYTVESENFESIHNHSAYASISRNKCLD